jgi:membrane protease YdiL (CAAX protease family)
MITVVFLVLLGMALLVPAETLRPQLDSRLLLVLGAGVAVFAVGRLVGGGHPPFPFTARIIALNTLAAVAEEAFFRRVVYAVLAPAGAAFAIGGAAVLFALVHLTVYGAWVLPIDLAAGLLFGWQRWATKSWSVPAATHALANVLVMV